MIDFIREWMRTKEGQERLECNAPKAGDLAPDFELRDINGEKPVRLSSLCERRPVALIFGSFT